MSDDARNPWPAALLITAAASGVAGGAICMGAYRTGSPLSGTWLLGFVLLLLAVMGLAGWMLLSGLLWSREERENGPAGSSPPGGAARFPGDHSGA